MELYLDVIWLDNLMVNFIILWVTWKLSGNAAPIWRLWCSACIGAFYAVLLILPGFSVLTVLPLKVLLSLAMLAAGFQIRSLRDIFKLTGFFYGTTFLLGGAAFGIYYFFNTGVEVAGGIFIIKDFPVKVLIFSVAATIMLYRWLWPVLRFRINKQQLVYKTEVWFDNRNIIIEAFLDTGNDLSDPISGKPVMVVEFEHIASILPYEIQGIFQQGREDQLEYIMQVMAGSKWISRFRIIPYQTLEHSGSMLLAFRPDKVRVFMNGSWSEVRDTLIGIRNKKLSANDDYHALIQPQIIQ